MISKYLWVRPYFATLTSGSLKSRFIAFTEYYCVIFHDINLNSSVRDKTIASALVNKVINFSHCYLR